MSNIFETINKVVKKAQNELNFQFEDFVSDFESKNSFLDDKTNGLTPNDNFAENNALPFVFSSEMLKDSNSDKNIYKVSSGSFLEDEPDKKNYKIKPFEIDFIKGKKQNLFNIFPDEIKEELLSNFKQINNQRIKNDEYKSVEPIEIQDVIFPFEIKMKDKIEDNYSKMTPDKSEKPLQDKEYAPFETQKRETEQLKANETNNCKDDENENKIIDFNSFGEKLTNAIELALYNRTNTDGY